MAKLQRSEGYPWINQKWDDIMDCVFIRDLLVRCVIGIFPEERDKKQDVLINVSMEADLRDACKSDAIEDSVDYKKVKQEIVTFAESSQYQLVEALADRVAEICLREPRVQRVEVTVEKPGAARFSRSVGVSIVREKG